MVWLMPRFPCVANRAQVMMNGSSSFLLGPAGHFWTDPGCNQSQPSRPQEGFIGRKETSCTLSRGLLTSDECIGAASTDDRSVYLRSRPIKPLHRGRSSRIDFLLQRISLFSLCRGEFATRIEKMMDEWNLVPHHLEKVSSFVLLLRK